MGNIVFKGIVWIILYLNRLHVQYYIQRDCMDNIIFKGIVWVILYLKGLYG